MAEIDVSLRTGRDDTPTEGPNALRWWQCVKPYSADAEPGIVLIGFACDEGVRRNGGRVGAKDGPQAIRNALANMAWPAGLKNVCDAGDVECSGDDLESAQNSLAQQVAMAMRAGHKPLLLGGGHETAWGTFLGVTNARPNIQLGVINIDSHLDLRSDTRANSGTPFKQIADWCAAHKRPFRYFCMGVRPTANTIALATKARELGAECIADFQLSHGWNRTSHYKDRLKRFIDGVDFVYLSIDLDVLPAAVMPGVSAPAGRGTPLEIVEDVILSVATCKKLIAADIVELNPRFDQDHRSARTAAFLAEWLARSWVEMEHSP